VTRAQDANKKPNPISYEEGELQRLESDHREKTTQKGGEDATLGSCQQELVTWGKRVVVLNLQNEARVGEASSTQRRGPRQQPTTTGFDDTPAKGGMNLHEEQEEERTGDSLKKSTGNNAGSSGENLKKGRGLCSLTKRASLVRKEPRGFGNSQNEGGNDIKDGGEGPLCGKGVLLGAAPPPQPA